MPKSCVFLYNFLFIIFVADSKHTNSRNGFEGLIVGGRPVDITAFPFAVMVFNRMNMCAGTILNRKLVMTAAHCFDFNKDIDDMRIQAGKFKIES